MTKESQQDVRQETTDPTELSQEERLEKLEERIAQSTGGELTFSEGEGLDPDLKEAFLENVALVEESGWTVPAELLREGGLELKPPADLDDEALSKKVWELVHAMALRNMYLDNTNHLSDRELYSYLVEDLLQEEAFMGPATPTRGFNFVIDLVGSGSDEHIDLSFKYYAGERERRSWMESFPEYDMPAREKPPYDRDRSLPQPDWTPPDEDEEETVM